MKARIVVLALVVGLTGLIGVSAAQPEGSVVIEGCLTAGPRPGYFILTDDVTGQEVLVAGVAELSQHSANHRERLTGFYDQNDTFHVDESEHLADACRPFYTRAAERLGELVTELRRTAALGVRVGAALDPELMVIGAHGEFATGVDHLLFRPNIEFGIGEVTAEYALNVEGIYRVPVTVQRGGRFQVWTVYLGGGPSVTVFNQEFRERDFNESTDRTDLFTFDDRDTEVGFNVLVGVERASGLFVEMKAGAYGNPAVRLLVGFTF